MHRYLFDTNILLLFLRNDNRWENIANKFDIANTRNYISIVSLGELESLAIQNEWGSRRLERLNDITNDFTLLDINIENIVKRYAQIDAYSQGRLRNRPLSMSARNMGKNDLWIAATAAALQLELITTDQDFNHLDKTYLDLAYIDIQKLV